MDFQNVDAHASNAVDVTRVARMPWYEALLTTLETHVKLLNLTIVSIHILSVQARYLNDPRRPGGY